jgi:hypothetical protein
MFRRKIGYGDGIKKHRERQEELWYRSEVAEAPGHPFYRKLEGMLQQAGFDQFCERECKRYYADGVGRPSLAPGVAGIGRGGWWQRPSISMAKRTHDLW